MKPFFERFKSDIKAMIWLTLGLFLALSLGSYNSSDPSLSRYSDSAEVMNYCGYFGSYLADILYNLFGLGSWFFTFLAFLFSWNAFKFENNLNRLKLLWSGLLAINLMALASLYFPEQQIYEQYFVGGVSGKIIAEGLKTLFNFVGVALLLWSFVAILVVFFTEKPLAFFLQIPIKWGKWLGFYLFELSVKAWAHRPQFSISFSKIKSWFKSRRSTSEIKSPKEKFIPIEEAPKRVYDKTLLPENGNEEELEFAELGEDEDFLEEEAVIEYAEDNAGKIKEPPAPSERRKVKLKAKVQRKVENWRLPEISMLEDPPASRYRIDEKEIRNKSHTLTDKLSQFSVGGEVTGIKPGPAVTMFEFKPRSDVKISKITELADDLSLALSSESVRIIAPIPGRNVVGIETSNQNRETVFLKDILAEEKFWDSDLKLPIALGRQADGIPKVVDLRKMPHLLVAGTTGSGKSVFVVSILTGLLFRHSPKTLRLILVDPKQVDLAAFNDVPHLLMPVILDPKKAVTALRWAVKEMEKRYRSMSKFGARGLESYNDIVGELSKEEVEEHREYNEHLMDSRKGNETYYFEPLPYIVVVVEEFGDLMAVDKSNVEQLVVRLAQMARACGIHLILAMQSPRKDVVTGLIKTNVPGRISFKVASKMDSRIILDEAGAERLLARGDMLFLAPGVAKPERHHGPWLTEKEIEAVMEFWGDQAEPEYDQQAMKILDGGGAGSSEFGDDSGFSEPEDEYDERYDEVLSWVSEQKSVSASLLQRKFRLGYPRAARIIEIFEKEGVVGPANGSKPRQVLINSFEQPS